MEKICVKKELYKERYEFQNFMEFFGFYFDFSGIFSDLVPLKKNKKGLFNCAGPTKLTWHGADDNMQS